MIDSDIYYVLCHLLCRRDVEKNLDLGLTHGQTDTDCVPCPKQGSYKPHYTSFKMFC